MYIGAPYNFNSLPEKTIVRDEKNIPALNEINDKNYSGEISYTITAKTDIFLGGADGNSFYRNIDKNYALKGSSFRGLVRSNMQILSLSGISDSIDGDFSMMYRKVGSAASDLKKQYDATLGVATFRGSSDVSSKSGSVSARKNVQAGILHHDEKGNYYIQPSKQSALKETTLGVQNYYIVRENTIIGALQRPGEKKKFSYLVGPGMDVLMHKHSFGYPFIAKGGVKRDAINTSFRPSIKEVVYHINTHRGEVDQIAAPGSMNGDDWHNGYFLSSGFMNKKKAHYIIEEENPDEKGFKIEEAAIKAYEADYNSRKNLFGTTQRFNGVSPAEKTAILKANEEYYKLPEKGSSKPVFYIRYNGHTYFGFTPNLRLYYEYTIADGIGNAKSDNNSYVNTILGFSNVVEGESKEKYELSRKSRVSFSDAVIDERKSRDPEGKAQNPVLGGPKPTSFYDYLLQDPKRVVTYNTKGFKLRGFKQYWLHEKAKDFSVEAGLQESKNKRVTSFFTPLKAGTVFHGKVRFNNLTEDELGLLLWSIRLDKGSEQNIGKAKAYGYGRIAVNIDDLKLFDAEKLYKSATLSFSPFIENRDSIEEQIDRFINAYINLVASDKSLLGKNLRNDYSVAQFLLMKDPAKMPDEKDIQYMSLNEDYRYRENERDLSKRYLPQPEVVAKDKNFIKNPYSYKPVAPEPVKKPSNGIEKGSVVEGVVNNYYRSGNVVKGVFLTLPGLKKGLLRSDDAAKNPSEYAVRSKVKVKVIEYKTEGGKTKILLSDKDI